nr:exopolysaccharide biosynthesis protein [Parvularcula dongshanensis]
MHRAVEKAREDGDLSVDELLGMFGSRSLGPLLILFGLIAAVPPIGGIPLVPTTMGVLTLLTASQLALGRRSVWVPGFIGRRAIGLGKLEKAEAKARKVTTRIDALVRRRLHLLTSGVMERVVPLFACVLALTMPPLEFVPFGVAVPGLALVGLGLGLVSKDGAFTLVGLIIGSATAALLIFIVPWEKVGELFGGGA